MTYLNGVLRIEIEDRVIRLLTRALTHHIVEELSISFLSTVKGLFSNMGSITDGRMPKLKPPKISVQEQNALAEAPAA